MRIPQSTRTVFSANPLAEVICQLKFPRLLEIEQELPVGFHRIIRKEFPEINVRPTVELTFTEPGSQPRQIVSSHYDFATADGADRISLSSEFIALTSTRYTGWGNFRAGVLSMLEAARTVYDISHINRVGLRYRNIIDRAGLGLLHDPWENLIKREVIGLAGAGIFQGDELSEQSCTYLASTERGTVRINTGLVKRVDTQSLGMLIDTDFATDEKMEAQGDVLTQVLDDYNAKAGNFFRWCITDRLRQALGPR
ncbi:TIGR04255 family protein [Mesorhizobium sp. M1409]|uniref:TIGR04255 family protein n=1 Tax=unclassified Mesorhizobium TaxID=325217 RepID=UPI003335839A